MTNFSFFFCFFFFDFRFGLSFELLFFLSSYAEFTEVPTVGATSNAICFQPHWWFLLRKSCKKLSTDGKQQQKKCKIKIPTATTTTVVNAYFFLDRHNCSIMAYLSERATRVCHMHAPPLWGAFEGTYIFCCFYMFCIFCFNELFIYFVVFSFFVWIGSRPFFGAAQRHYLWQARN